MSRIFDPSHGDGSILVASITSSEDAHHAARDFDREREEYEHALRMRDMRELGFGARQSVCG